MARFFKNGGGGICTRTGPLTGSHRFPKPARLLISPRRQMWVGPGYEPGLPAYQAGVPLQHFTHR